MSCHAYKRNQEIHVAPPSFAAQEDCLFLETGPTCPRLKGPQFRMTYFPEKMPEARDIHYLEAFQKKYKLDAMVVLKLGIHYAMYCFDTCFFSNIG